MARMAQFDYLFAVGTLFAFLDAWNIGANDVANSWASSVSSRSIGYVKAMIGASILEFSGAVGVGGRVADTIRTKVVDVAAFNDEPEMLLLGMVCAIIASACYLTIATKIGMPVSTTHSILGGVLGMGIGALGGKGIVWVGHREDGSVDMTQGVVQVFLAWVIAPVIAGVAGAILFTFTKYAILLRPRPAMKGLMLFPLYFWLTGSLIAMLLIWKGGDYKINLTESQIPGVIVASGAAFSVLITIFLIPWVYRIVIKEDWQLRPWHIIQGPHLLRRGDVPPPPANFQGVVRNFYDGHLTQEELDARRAQETSDEMNHRDGTAAREKRVNGASSTWMPGRKGLVGPKPKVPWYHISFLWWGFKFLFLRGVDIDIIAAQKANSPLSGDIEAKHARSSHYDNRAEFLYTFLQIMTASAASFVHGANDVSNAVGPYATIYHIWNTGINPVESNVPIWILAFGGAGIALGVWTYGYHIMSNLGNRLTLMSPSRGFCMELGSTIAIVVATRLRLPVSTTQCITGAIVGVGFCNGDWRSINWRMVAWTYMGWVITVPATAIIAGSLMSFTIHAPNWS